MLSRLFFRALPILLVCWAVRSGAVHGRGVFKKAGDMVKVVQCKRDMNMIALTIREFYIQHKHLPDSFYFSEWLRGQPIIKDRSAEKDRFGNPYSLEEIEDGFELVSNGPDGQPRTRDDIRKRVERLSQAARDYK